MLTRRLHILAATLCLALAAALVGAACGLNPQPIPPGANGAEGDGGLTAPVSGETEDAGVPSGATGGNGEGGTPVPPPTSIDGGESDGGPDAADGGSADAASDASGDAASDASSDANEDGG
jgi:hypothetical protein